MGTGIKGSTVPCPTNTLVFLASSLACRPHRTASLSVQGHVPISASGYSAQTQYLLMCERSVHTSGPTASFRYSAETHGATAACGYSGLNHKPSGYVRIVSANPSAHSHVRILSAHPWGPQRVPILRANPWALSHVWTLCATPWGPQPRADGPRKAMGP